MLSKFLSKMNELMIFESKRNLFSKCIVEALRNIIKRYWKGTRMS